MADSMDEVHARLTKVFRDVFDRPDIEITRETIAPDIEEWDSLNHVLLIVAVEREFGVKLSSSEIDGLDHVGALMDIVQGKLR
jgi:acyl carrier protein